MIKDLWKTESQCFTSKIGMQIYSDKTKQYKEKSQKKIVLDLY